MKRLQESLDEFVLEKYDVVLDYDTKINGNPLYKNMKKYDR